MQLETSWRYFVACLHPENEPCRWCFLTTSGFKRDPTWLAAPRSQPISSKHSMHKSSKSGPIDLFYCNTVRYGFFVGIAKVSFGLSFLEKTHEEKWKLWPYAKAMLASRGKKTPAMKVKSLTKVEVNIEIFYKCDSPAVHCEWIGVGCRIITLTL